MTQAMKNRSAEWTRLCQAQRRAYFDWQNAPAGAGQCALDAYLAANKAQDEFRAKAAA